MNFTTSEQLFQKAKQYFPGGVNSPVRAFKSVGGTPLFMEKGKGSTIWDVDGNKYTDYCCSWGPLILGHAHDKVLKAINQSMQNGTSFGTPTRLENELAELILNHNSFIEKIRFVSSGTEAVMSAVRMARGYTEKHKIIKFNGCYHGHSDALLVEAGSGLATFSNPSSAGVTPNTVMDTIVVPLNDQEKIKDIFKQYANQIAAVIIEPIPANNGLLIQPKEFLQFLRDICTEYNALLIFDEVISGFRIGFTGAAGYYQIKPDIITYGKIIGGGLPVGAYASSADIMKTISPDGNVYQAGTLSGNPMAMSAGIAQLKECLKPDFYLNLETKTKKLVEGLSQNTRHHFKVSHIGSIFWLAFSNKLSITNAQDIDPQSMQYFKLLFQELLLQGVYIGPSGYEVGFVSEAHSNEDIEFTINAFNKAFEKI